MTAITPPKVTVAPVSGTFGPLLDVVCARCGTVEAGILGADNAGLVAAEHRERHFDSAMVAAACCCAAWIAAWIAAGFLHASTPVRYAIGAAAGVVGWFVAKRINRT